jgi:hypothetical protein
MVNVTAVGPKVVIVSVDFPSTVAITQMASMKVTVRNDGDQAGSLSMWVKNESSSPGAVTVEEVTYKAGSSRLSRGGEVMFYTPYPSVSIGVGESKTVEFNFYSWEAPGSYYITVSSGHSGTKDDSRTVGCPEGEQAQSEAERYASM